MNRNEIRAALLRVLRQQVLGGSDREIEPTSPLGAEGIGLDSLALLEFVTAVEHEFGMEFPDSIWTDRGMLSPETFVDIILEFSERTRRIAPRSRAQTENVGVATDSYLERMRAAIASRGVVLGMAWIVRRIAARIASGMYAREGHVILAREFGAGDVQHTARATNLSFKQLFVEDLQMLEALWAPHHQLRMFKHLNRRLNSGFFCLTAWRGEEVVGIDYLSTSGDFDTDTGLEVVTLPGTCYALDLYEKYRGEGIGVALLEYSLQETVRRGLKRQVTFVRKNNSPMLATSVQLCGFTKIGEITTTRWFGRPTSSWSLGTISGKNGTIQF